MRDELGYVGGSDEISYDPRYIVVINGWEANWKFEVIDMQAAKVYNAYDDLAVARGNAERLNDKG